MPVTNFWLNPCCPRLVVLLPILHFVPCLFHDYLLHALSLQSDSSLRVSDLDTDGLSLGNNLNSVLGRNIVGNLSSVGLGVHQQNIQVLDVLDQVNSVARWNHVLSLLVGTVTDGGLTDSASESSSDARVNTLLLSPVLTDSVVSVRVVSLESLGVLLDNRRSHCG